MPRFPRSYIKTNYFHVITQGINKSYIFNVDEDIKYYIKSMYESSKSNCIEIVDYCIMNNHAHMLVNVKRIENLSKYMHSLNTKYGKYYNKKYNRVGYVFRDRYKAEGIYSENHLYNCISYIYNNPVKAGICGKPEEYLYSNYKNTYNTIDEGYNFLDIEDERDDEEIIKDYMIENGLKIVDLMEKHYELKQAIVTLKRDKGISLRSISRILGINREVVRKIYNE